SNRRALELRQRLLAARPDDLKRHSDVGASFNNVGMTLAAQGKHREALEQFEKALEHQRRAFDKAPQVPRYRLFLRNHYSNLSNVQRALGRPAEAAAAALAFRQLFPKDPNNLYVAAQELAQCVPLVGRDSASLSPEERADRQKYTALAVETLRQALAAGFKQAYVLARDPAFQAIRADPGFQALLARKPAPKQR